MSPPPPPRGALIVLEGCDRVGKSTQCALLAQRLAAAGVRHAVWRFPDRTSFSGRALDSYLRGGAAGADAEGGDGDKAAQAPAALDDATVHLLFAANRAALEAALAGGTTLVVDRYAYSGVAYTSAKAVPRLGLDWCKAPDTGLPQPDCVVWLRLGAGAASSRPGFGGERYETAPFQAAVAHAYDALSEGWWSRVDAGGAAEEVAARVWAAAAPAVAAAAAGAPLRRLWDGSGGDDGGGGGAR